MATPRKKEIAAMMPVKKWLTGEEACSFLNIGLTTLKDQDLTISAIGSKKYYKVAELERIIEKNIFINQIN